MMNRIFCTVLILFAFPALADHESAESILGQVRQYAPRTYKLQPAQRVRELPVSQTHDTHRLKAELETLSKGVFGVVMLESGAIVSENYANGADASAPVNLYSATKSLTALAVGEALCAGKIKSLDDLASVYVPALIGTAYGAASIRNLLGYTSGAKDPGGTGYSGIHNSGDFSSMMRQEIGLIDLMKKHGDHSQYRQGDKFIYNGLDSESLSLVVRGATGMPLPQWFESTVWQKAGGEYPAAWFTDNDGNGIGEALVWITTRDFLRIGLYTLERLTGKSSDSCMNTFVNEAAQPRTAKGYWLSAPYWGLGLHIGADKNIWFFGHGAQRVGINQKTGRIVAMNGFSEWKNMDMDIQRLFNR